MKDARKDFRVMRIQGDYNFTRDDGEILKALLDSKERGTMIALAVPFIGAGVFITAVDDLFLNDGETYIQIKNYDVTGRIIEKTRIPLREIIGACPLNSQWSNPFLKNITNDSEPITNNESSNE